MQKPARYTRSPKPGVLLPSDGEIIPAQKTLPKEILDTSIRA
ncbi:hypothetical protein ACPOL_0339 [Acidisarcina polymorpha]|uniref:Uncharacterized protein n=1 Tax=Acidisarcina polymorpha TaxID=2211140 RepID=A0A2Z5FSD5_9BACT|nr:hypothetical protein ACPOL_0339 [Acidisarcina polymorpha]